MREHEIGVTELRQRLYRYIKLVEEGNVIRITKYGKVIGYIVPAQIYLKNIMDNLVTQGVIHWGGKPLSPWAPVAKNDRPVQLSDLVINERGKR